jgi:hypothetical protein
MCSQWGLGLGRTYEAAACMPITVITAVSVLSASPVQGWRWHLVSMSTAVLAGALVMYATAQITMQLKKSVPSMLTSVRPGDWCS